MLEFSEYICLALTNDQCVTNIILKDSHDTKGRLYVVEKLARRMPLSGLVFSSLKEEQMISGLTI